MNLFTWNPDEEKEARLEPGTQNRCTPELLLDYCLEVQAIEKRLPTLAELKKKFGGILGPLVCAWKLQEQGLLQGKKVVR